MEKKTHTTPITLPINPIKTVSIKTMVEIFALRIPTGWT